MPNDQEGTTLEIASAYDPVRHTYVVCIRLGDIALALKPSDAVRMLNGIQEAIARCQEGKGEHVSITA